MTVCPDTVVVLLIMTLVFIISAKWIRSIFSYRAQSGVPQFGPGQTLSDDIIHILDSDDSENLTEAQQYSLYAEFYGNMGEDELKNLDNYLDRE